jgi:methyl-accepting chemotaxis protein
MKTDVKKKILLLVALFVLIIVVIGFSTIFIVNGKVLITAHEKLKSDLAMGRALLNEKHPGDWSVREGKLFKGDVAMNGNFAVVDTIGELTGDTVTLFQGDTRVSTNVKKSSGERAVGTRAAQNVIDATLTGGKLYIGKAEVVGIWNQTAYEPIKNAGGEIIGMFYVGVPNTRYDEISSDIGGQIIIISLIGLIIVGALSLFLIKSITGPLIRVIAGITDGADQVSSAASQVASASQQLAEGTSAQASSLEETSSSLEEMSSMTRQNADHANEAKAMMTEASQIVEKVNLHMNDMAGAVAEITRSSEETGKIIKTAYQSGHRGAGREQCPGILRVATDRHRQPVPGGGRERAGVSHRRVLLFPGRDGLDDQAECGKCKTCRWSHEKGQRRSRPGQGVHVGADRFNGGNRKSERRYIQDRQDHR